MNKTQTIDLLRSQMPGFYSVEQVINLIEKIEEEQSTPKLTVDQVRELTHIILASAVCCNGGFCCKLLVSCILLNFVVNEKSVHLSRH